jgi:hypothetical protein
MYLFSISYSTQTSLRKLFERIARSLSSNILLLLYLPIAKSISINFHFKVIFLRNAQNLQNRWMNELLVMLTGIQTGNQKIVKFTVLDFSSTHYLAYQNFNSSSILNVSAVFERSKRYFREKYILNIRRAKLHISFKFK